MNIRLKSVMVIAALLTLNACAFDQEARKETDTHYGNTDSQASQRLKIENDKGNKPRHLITSVQGNWLGGKSIPVSQDVELPDIFYQKWNFNFPGRVNIGTAAERITLVTGIPVLVKPDAYLPLAKFLNNAAAPTTAPVAGVTQGVGLTGTDASLAAQYGSINNNVVSDFSSSMELNFEGTLADFLDRISSRATLSWEYKNNRIEFFRITTKTFTLKAPPGDASQTTSVGKTGTTQGGTTASTTGGTTGSSSFSSDSTIKTNSTVAVWTSIDGAIKSMLSPVGRYSINQATGTITVSDGKDAVDTIGRFIDHENLTLNRQVRLKVEVFNVILNKNYEEGVDWNLVYNRLTDFGITLSSPTTLVDSQASSLGFKITSTDPSTGLSRWNGTQAMLKALSGLGKASITNTTNAVTSNRKPVPIAITDQVTYIAQTTPGTSVAGGAAGAPGLTPATVTTGFILNLLPTVNDNGSISVQIGLDLSTLKALTTVTSGTGANQQSIQTPEVSGKTTQQSVLIRSGETLVLAGFESVNNQYKRSTLNQNGNSGLEGSINGTNQREALVLMITPVIEDN